MFDQFWETFPHRDNRGSKPRARMIFTGARPTESGKRYTDEDRHQIMLGLEAHQRNLHHSSDAFKFRQSAPVWLYQESYVTALEIDQARQSRESELTEADRQRQAAIGFTRAYKAWEIDQRRAGNTDTSVEAYKATLFKVVGG